MNIQKYVTYYRVSTQKQGKSGLGMDAQKAAVNQYINQFGGQIIASFQEVESGKRSDRVEFNKALDYVELTDAVLLVAKLDRLSRDLHVITTLQKRGIKFRFCDTPEIDSLTIHVMAAVAENELKLISSRTKNALREARKKGIKLGNPNLDVVRNRDVNEANAARVNAQKLWREKILKIISHIESEGHETCRAIADELNRRGITSYRGAKFTVPIVSKIMRCRNVD